jgi:hypothetical protein
MSTTRDTGFLRNAVQVTNQGIVFVSGSTLLMSISSSGAVTTTGVISGSNALSASFSLNSALLNGTGSVGFTTTASFLAVSSSQQQISASLLQVSASYISLSGSYNTFSGSASTRITANSSSIQQVSSSLQQISASLLNVVATYATTGSNSFRADQSITGSLVVSSTITAQTLVVQTVTSSILYSSGSNVFGNQLANTQTFTGSLNVTGSMSVTGSITSIQSNITNATTGPLQLSTFIGSANSSSFTIASAYASAQYLANAVAGDTILRTETNNLRIGTVLATGVIAFGNTTTEYMRITGSSVGIGTTNPAYTLDVTGTGRFTGILTAQTGILFPTTQTVSSTGSIGFNSTQGLFIYTKTGTSYDFKVYNGVGSTFMQVPTGTQNVEFLGTATTAGQIALNASFGTSTSAISIYNNAGSSASNIARLEFRVNNTFNGNERVAYITATNPNAAGNNGGQLAFAVSPNGTSTTPVTALTIMAGGNVGIGTTSIVNASAKLEVKGDLFMTPSGSAASKLHLYNADSSNESYIYDAGGTSSSVITLAPAGSTSLSVAATSVKIASGRKLVINSDTSYQSLAEDLSFSSGIREIFRVPHQGLCTGGKFSIVGTGNSFVHSSQWMWNSTHNGGYGRAYAIQLTSGEYSNITMYVDTTSSGDVIICTNLGGAYTMQLVIEKTSGGAIDLTYQNADRTSAASGYTRVQTTTSISYGSQFYSVVAATLGGSGNRAVYSDSVGLLTNSSSDVTLKKNVENIAYGLNSIMSLRPIAFNWIPENLGQQKEIGFIAQEVQESIPELIGTNKDETLSLDYPKLTAVLTKAIQELKLENDSLKEILQRNNIN